MKPPWRMMTFGDWLVAGIFLGLALAGMLLVASAPAGTRVVVVADGQTRFTAGLDQHQVTDIEGPLGATRLIIDARGARVDSSPCPRKLCMQMGPAKETNDLIACVPNRILVRIDGAADSTERPYDLLSR